MPTQQKIRYSDCDAQAIVFNANYPRYWDDALTDWLEDAGFGGPELGGIGAELVTARTEIDYKAPARLGDVLETTPVVERIGNTSMTIGLTTHRLSDGQVVAVGRQVVVFVDPGSHTPIRVPDQIRERVSRESDLTV